MMKGNPEYLVYELVAKKYRDLRNRFEATGEEERMQLREYNHELRLLLEGILMNLPIEKNFNRYQLEWE